MCGFEDDQLPHFFQYSRIQRDGKIDPDSYSSQKYFGYETR